MSRARLSGKRRVWLEWYLRTWNATEAARQAGYRHPRVLGLRVLKDPVIQELISARIAEMAMGADEVLLRLAEQARGEQAAYRRGDGTVDLERLLADGKGHLVKATRWDRGGNLIVDFYDAQRALEMLGKGHRLFVDTVEHSGRGGEALRINVVWDESGLDDSVAEPPPGPDGGQE